MNKISKIYSLRYRMLIALGISVAIASCVYFLFTAAANSLIATYYLSESAYRKRTDEYAGQFSQYVAKNHLASTDTDALKEWVRANPYNYVSIYDENGVIWESGWWDDTVSYALDAESFLSEGGGATGDDTAIAAEAPAFYNWLYRITFRDGTFFIAVTDFSDETVYRLSHNAVAVFSILLVFPIVLIYARKISKRVICLTEEVQQISSGNLHGDITIRGKDELALLANQVDHMRHSVIEQLEKEQIAWRANSDLITSMSHDIRTPLTILLGYTGLIKNKQYATPEEFDSYIDVIEKKSLQLKELSDKLFRYFLIFGNDAPVNFEVVDAEEIFAQLIGEHTVLLQDSGFSFVTEPLPHSCTLQLDLSYAKRLFDNIFSNIEKYGDQTSPCQISPTLSTTALCISITNKIRADLSQVESTRIGIKTCKKIMEQMNGQFTTDVDSGFFTVFLTFPVSTK